MNSDISWRSMDDDETWALLVKNPNAQILIETSIAFRIDRAEYVEDRPLGPWLATANEKVKRIAFL